MNLPGLLIEYLINGSIALIWILCLIDISSLAIIIDDQQLLLIPLIYVIGMIIDYVAWVITKMPKKWIRDRALVDITDNIIKEGEVFDKAEYEYFWNEKMIIEKNYPDLNKELTSRSSRDRIARGFMLNMIPISILYWEQLHMAGIVLFILSVVMWAKFEKYNRQFELRAAHSVRTDSTRSK